jgi:hypothetical protein
MTWTRAHDAHIARECEGLEVFEPENWPADMPLVYGDYIRVSKYNTDPAACIRAAEVLRNARAGHLELRQAEEMGADALEFQSWLFDDIDDGLIRVVVMYERWNCSHSFLDYCKAEWEKERRP